MNSNHLNTNHIARLSTKSRNFDFIGLILLYRRKVAKEEIAWAQEAIRFGRGFKRLWRGNDAKKQLIADFIGSNGLIFKEVD